MANDIIYYEQPRTELVRTCLRIEYLDQIIQHNLKSESPWDAHQIVRAIVDIIDLLDRPDLKSKFIAEFQRFHDNLLKLHNVPNVNNKKLTIILEKLNHILIKLRTNNSKFANKVREINFISTIRQHLMNPGGTCNTDTPSYHYWLHLPAYTRNDFIQSCLEQLQEAYLAVNLLLQLARESTESFPITATNGFYQCPLDEQNSYLLTRVQVNKNIPAYPLISINKHCLSIYFYDTDLSARPKQTEKDISCIVSY